MRTIFVVVQHEKGVDHFRLETRSNCETQTRVHVNRIVEARLGKVEAKIDIRPDVDYYLMA